MYKILVPYNFNEESKNALRHAGKLAAKKNAKIDVVHIVEGGDSASFSAMGAPNTNSAKDIALVEMVKRLKKKLDLEIQSLVNIQFLDKVDVRVASYEKTISSIILNHKADLIVMGTEGFHGSREVFVQSTSEIVADEATVPVLVVGEKTPLVDYEHLVYASHFEKTHQKEMANISSFLMDLGADIDLLKITEEKVDSKEEERLRQVAHSIQFDKTRADASIVNSNDPAEAIEAFMERKKGDVLTMNAHHLTGISRFFKDSMVEEFINKFRYPVMVMNVN